MSSSDVCELTDSFHTYDVFDTVLTRMVGEPISAFLLLGYHLVRQGLWIGTGEQFAVARVSAEVHARWNDPSPEITFAGIYRELGHAFSLDTDRLESISREELLFEARLLRAVPAINRRLSEDRARGTRLGFISDMYLPGETIRKWLRDCGVFLPNDLLWVSSISRQTKGEGALFDLVAKETSAVLGKWRHTGDNPVADYASPRARGITALLFDECHLTSSEKLMESYASRTCGLSSLFAGAARWTRLTLDKESSPCQATLNAYAAHVAGPALYAFVLWVLHSAKREGVNKIWFMARDGQIMIPIAKEIARRLELDVDVGYLYAGRQIVKIAALREIGDAEIEWMLHGAHGMELFHVFRRVGLSQDEFEAQVEVHGLPRSGPIGQDRLSNLRAFLLSPQVTARILEVAAERRSTVLDYFAHSGLTGGSKCCIVDLGWRGTVVKGIDDLIGRENCKRHVFLYFGLYGRPSGTEDLRMKGYLFDVDGAKTLGIGRNIHSLSALLETFAQADHGPVLQIVRSGEGFEPVCAPEDPQERGQWDVRFFQQRLLCFSHAVMAELAVHRVADMRPLVAALLQRSLGQPDVGQAQLLSTIRFADGPEGSSPQQINRAYRVQDLPAAYRQGGWPHFGMNWWFPGAYVLTPRPVRFMIRIAGKLGRVARARFGARMSAA